MLDVMRQGAVVMMQAGVLAALRKGVLVELVPLLVSIISLVGLVSAAAVTIYVALIYMAWTVVWLTQGRDPRLTAHPVRAILVEWFAVYAILALALLSFGRRFKQLRAGRSDGVPVLCVHGYTQNFGNFIVLSAGLERAGSGPVFGVNLRGRFSSVEVGAEDVAAALRRIVELTGAAQVDVVAHSMGGLVTRLALHRHDVQPLVRRVVTLGCPHAGTHLAHYGLGANAREMRIKSAFLASLPKPPVFITSVWSTTDAVVLPVNSAATGVRDVIFTDLGHLGLLLSPRVIDVVAQTLTRPEPPQDVDTVHTSGEGTTTLAPGHPEPST